MNIVIVTSGHPPFDERIFYKFGISLNKYGHKTAIVCSTKEISTISEGISIKGFSDAGLSKKEKISKLFDLTASFNPSLIICCEPLTILAAERYKKQIYEGVKIIYDITEYYPHQNTLVKYSGTHKIIQYLRLSLFNAWVSNLADYLFIGEKGKAKFYHFTAPFVKKAIIGYYPPKRNFHYSPPVYDGKHFTLCYAGRISKANGFPAYLALVRNAAERFKDKVFIAKIVGSKQNNYSALINELLSVQNIKVIHHDTAGYKEFAFEFDDVDLCIDLREKNVVFNRSLPIKIFDYIACGKPFIFSRLKSFKGFEDLRGAGLLIEPDDFESALGRIAIYLDKPEKLKADSLEAYRLFTEKYNWEKVETKLIAIVNSLVKNQ